MDKQYNNSKPLIFNTCWACSLTLTTTKENMEYQSVCHKYIVNYSKDNHVIIIYVLIFEGQPCDDNICVDPQPYRQTHASLRFEYPTILFQGWKELEYQGLKYVEYNQAM